MIILFWTACLGPTELPVDPNFTGYEFYEEASGPPRPETVERVRTALGPSLGPPCEPPEVSALLEEHARSWRFWERPPQGLRRSLVSRGSQACSRAQQAWLAHRAICPTLAAYTEHPEAALAQYLLMTCLEKPQTELCAALQVPSEAEVRAALRRPE
jgi:hypothetical protein